MSILKFLFGKLVTDVPPELEECEICREIDCTKERWLRCEKRLAALQEINKTTLYIRGR